jgi:hypothetical protein
MPSSEVRARNLDEVKRVSSKVKEIQLWRVQTDADPFWIANESNLDRVSRFQREVSWILLDEKNALKGVGKCAGQLQNYTSYRAIFDGKWYLIVEVEQSKYGVIHEYLNRALGYWTVVDKVLETEPRKRGVKRSSKRIQRMLDWMCQDAWDLRQVCHANTFRGVLAMVGGYCTRETVNSILANKMGLCKLKPQKVWIRFPPTPIPIPMPVVPDPPEQDWRAWADSMHGTADAWAGRAFCPVCHTVNTTRPFCIECGTLLKLTHNPIQSSDLSYLDWR